MIYALGFYWIVAGFVMVGIVKDQFHNLDESLIFLFAFICGGFLLPARLLAKVVK